MSNTTTDSFGELVARRADQLRQRGDAGGACRDFNKAYNLLRSEGKACDPIMRDCLHMWGVALCSKGNPAEALSKFRQAIQLSIDIGDQPSRMAMGNIMRDEAKAQMLLGELDRAEECLISSQQILKPETEWDQTALQGLANTIGFQGRLEVHRHNLGLALQYLREADRLLGVIGADQPRLYNLLVLSRTAHMAGMAEAAGHARAAWPLAKRYGGRSHRIRAMLLMLPITWRLEARMSS